MVPTLGGYLHGENLFVSPRFHVCIVFAFFHMLLSVSYGPDAVDIGFVSSAGQSWEMRIEKTLVKYTTQRMNCESTQQSDISTKIWKATWEDNRENKVLKEKGATGNGMEPLHPFCWPKYQLAARSLFTTKVLSTSAGILPELMTKTYKNLGSVKVYVPPLGTHCFKLSRGWNAVRIPWDLRSITTTVKEKHNQTSWYHKVCRSSSKSAKCACWGLVYGIGGVYTGETCIAVHLP